MPAVKWSRHPTEEAGSLNLQHSSSHVLWKQSIVTLRTIPEEACQPLQVVLAQSERLVAKQL